MTAQLVSERPRISVIIPARNEAPNLLYVLPRIPSFIYEVILVNGHSTDETVTTAQYLFPTIRVIEQVGRGKGNAIKVGLSVASGDIVVLLDADGSADPLEIPRFVEGLLAGNDFAKGSRFTRGGDSYDITLLRRVGNHLLSMMVNVLFGTRFTDLCYGYNVFWKSCLDHITIDSDGFEIETLMNIRAYMAGLKIIEIPSFEHQRVHGQSNLNTFKDGWRVLQTIFRERGRTRRELAPGSVPLPHQQVTSARECISISEDLVL